jgi:hypothetical protein
MQDGALRRPVLFVRRFRGWAHVLRERQRQRTRHRGASQPLPREAGDRFLSRSISA